ncbi:tumor necrosis factor receptor superfamily member 6-like isoform X1 [Pelobates fuscus]|uniref:tumor necrosis factor receptor superfamily member 6-like isoform X1 n=1 Tax=Pelobates fuscus TaxID=191477 RepID=UPI002FE4612B
MGPTGVISSQGMSWWLPLKTFIFLTILLIAPVTDGLPQRLSRNLEQQDNDYFYTHGKIKCRVCPAGFHVEEHCTIPNTNSTCEPCDEDSYSEGPTGLMNCHTCTHCRTDQEEVSACTNKKNTVCQCRSGTYCLPDNPCEICHKCSTSCPEGEVVKHPCNATADIQCSQPSISNRLWRCINIVSAILFVSVGVIAGYRVLEKRWSRTTRKLSRLLPCKGGTDSPFNQRSLVTLDFNQDGDKSYAMSNSFYIFHEKVPFDNWKNFMRRLHLEENKIREAESKDPGNAKEQHYNMLDFWYQSSSGSVNDLLKALSDLKMHQQALDIIDELLKDKLFVVAQTV